MNLWKAGYQKAESILEPEQWLVVALLLAVIGISVYLIVFSRSAVARTLWLIYLLSP